MMDPDDGGNTGKIRAEGGNGIRANPIPYQGGARSRIKLCRTKPGARSRKICTGGGRINLKNRRL